MAFPDLLGRSPVHTCTFLLHVNLEIELPGHTLCLILVSTAKLLCKAGVQMDTPSLDVKFPCSPTIKSNSEANVPAKGWPGSDEALD